MHPAGTHTRTHPRAQATPLLTADRVTNESFQRTRSPSLTIARSMTVRAVRAVVCATTFSPYAISAVAQSAVFDSEAASGAGNTPTALQLPRCISDASRPCIYAPWRRLRAGDARGVL